MQSKTWLLAAAIAIAATALLIAGCGGSSSGGSTSGEGDESGVYRMGLEAPLTGEQAVLGQGMLKGAQLATEQINKKGGILGRKVKLVPIDDAADPETGVKAAEAAIEEGLDGIVGPYNSGVGIETLPLYIEAGLVPIRLTSDSSTNGLGYTLQPMDYQIAPVASEALTDWLQAKSVAIAYDPTQNYTVSVSKALKALLEKEGVEVTAYAKVKPGEKSYSGLVKELASKNPDVIYSAVYFPEGGPIAKEMHESGVKSKCVADYASYDTGFVETAGKAAAQACPVVGVPAPADFEDASESICEYKKKFKQEPGTWSPYAYDSTNLLAEETEIAGTTEAGTLEETLDAVKGWTGWTGSVTFNPDNGNREPATVVIADTDAKGNLHVDKSWAKAVGAPYTG